MLGLENPIKVRSKEIRKKSANELLASVSTEKLKPLVIGSLVSVVIMKLCLQKAE